MALLAFAKPCDSIRTWPRRAATISGVALTYQGKLYEARPREHGASAFASILGDAEGG